MNRNHIVRGYGFLDTWIGNIRCKFAEKQINSTYRKGRICDIGCGAYPKFLLKTKFKEKYGLDQLVDENYIEQFSNTSINFMNLKLDEKIKLPFKDNNFDVVTMLAIIEHLNAASAENIIKEIFRTLKTSGILILSTPNAWVNPLLKFMAAVGLASRKEIDDHKQVFNKKSILNLLKRGKFRQRDIKVKFFEFYMNICVVAKKN